MCDKQQLRKYGIHGGLFILTLITTTLAGAEWIHGRLVLVQEDGTLGWANWLGWNEFVEGMKFSVPFIGILLVHEMGHYITALRYKVKASLPYFIPLWLGFTSTIGTIGAFISMKSRLRSRNEIFDIGIAGPIAGFVVALGVLFYGFSTLPEPESYIFNIHPEYAQFETAEKDFEDHVYKKENLPEGTVLLATGDNILFWLFENYLTPTPEKVPNAYEIIHYPFLFAGFLALFFTALNMIPVGQLDGGHVLYGLLGHEWHKLLSRSFFIAFVFYAGLGVLGSPDGDGNFYLQALLYGGFLYIIFSRLSSDRITNLLVAVGVMTGQYITGLVFPGAEGFSGWLVFAFLIGRILGIHHPRTMIDQPMDRRRKIIGWIGILIFILCFTPKPFIVETPS